MDTKKRTMLWMLLLGSWCEMMGLTQEGIQQQDNGDFFDSYRCVDSGTSST